MVAWSSKHAIVVTILSGALAVAGCTTVTPRFEPAPTAKHRTKVVRTTTAPKVVKHKKVTAKKLIKPVQTETTPAVPPPAVGGGNGGGGGGWGG
ncbi:conserved exported hypothetical protein [Mesorhizobium plurifarium]|uniref:Lipoprotein n=1 Tax=Mesorhizobium plurifarium TaxID=69974 RepID=A0A0K2W3Z3_MESPL|nr:conserved exported hypothetical protein [Mesorhizobium plurifarium]